jgi:C1A family cysteine protease
MQARAFKYLESHKAELEKVYPYTSGTTKKSSSCAYSKDSTTAVEASTYKNVTANNPSQMKAALVQQPLAVSIEADKRVFQTYKSGIMDSTACGTKLDHAVLAVGYGSENGQDYWLVKNSWNTTWGDQGYIKLGMDDTNGTCGVQMDPQTV